MFDHPVDLPVSRDGEFEADPEAVDQRVPGAECRSIADRRPHALNS